MKRILMMGMTTVLSLSIVPTTMVFAETSTAKSVTTNTAIVAPTAEQKTETTGTAPSPKEDAELKDRLEKHKAELKIKLNAAEKTRIEARCVAAQGVVSKVKGRAKGLETSRTEVYSNITGRLTDLSVKFKNKGTDTTVLDADLVILKQDIATFNSDLAVYKQNVSDLATLDCKAEPDAFKAALLATRTSLETVNKDAAAVRTYVNDTIKPLLKTLRSQLETNKTGGSQ